MRIGRTGSAAVVGIAMLLAGCASQPPPAPPPAPPSESTEKSPDTGEAAVYLVTAKSANVREGPSTSSSTVGRVKKGDRVTSFEENGDWLRVKMADTRAGWIRKDLLKKDEGCLPDRPGRLLSTPVFRMSASPEAKGKVVLEADVDAAGAIRSVRVVENATGSPTRAETAKSELADLKFSPAVKRCKPVGFTYVYTRTF